MRILCVEGNKTFRSILEKQLTMEGLSCRFLANGAEGYIPPPEQHRLGGYTTWPARTAGLEVQAEPQIVDKLLQLMETLSGEKRKPLTTDFYNDQQRTAIKKARAEDNNRVNRGE